MVVVLCTVGTGVGVVVPDGLEAGYGIREYAYPIMCSELNKSRVYGYQFRSHDGAGLFCSRNIHVDDSVGGNVDHRRN